MNGYEVKFCSHVRDAFKSEYLRVSREYEVDRRKRARDEFLRQLKATADANKAKNVTTVQAS